ncbi:MAG: TonB-dependent receptor domain-containing protein [Pseudobacter sp.]|uniref:SusC/RagA family TonB-linked outer membrane protein n=1 Tax=Pseudobacter sp. TaxID=2045420 RepID=UPI003F80FFD2
MKLTVFLLTAACLNVAAKGLSQSVTYSGKKVSLEQVFSAVEKQTGYLFLYQEKALSKARPVTVTAVNLPLLQFLDAIFDGQPLRYSISSKTINIFPYTGPITPDDLKPGMPGTELAQNLAFPVSGRVLDPDGKPVSGANIMVKGTKNGVSAGADGSFTINVNTGDILKISAVSFSEVQIRVVSNTSAVVVSGEGQSSSGTDDKKVTVLSGNPASGLFIRLPRSSVKLNEVQVTAYNIEKRTKELGYSVTKVSGEEINKANSGNLLTGLIGKVSGMTITTQSSDMTPEMRILVRGIRSFGQNSNNQPMFILNGAPLSFGTDQNAANQAMYFINNINPADIENVTVLKGANGTALYGPEGINGVVIITTKKGQLGKPTVNFRNNTSFQVVDYRRERRQRSFGTGSGLTDEFGNGVFDPRSTYGWGPKYDGSMVPIGYPDENGEIQMVPYSDTKDARKFLNVARMVRNNLTFSSSDARSSFYLGLGHVMQTGLLPKDKQNQSTILLNTSRNFGVVDVRMNVNYAHTSDDRGPDVAASVRNLPTFIPLLRYKDYQNDHWSQRDRYWNYISPAEQIDNDRTKATTNALSGNLVFQVKPFNWLTIREQPGINYTGAYSKGTKKPVDFSGFAAQDPNKMWNRLASVSENMNSSTSINNDIVVSTLHHPGNFLLRTNIGNTIRENYTKQLKAGSELVIPVYNLAFYRFAVPADEVAILSRSWSLFGNVSMGYKDRVFLELTGRNEWDSKRAKVARGQDTYFGANTSLVLTEIFPALKNWKWLTTARLRASVAQSANMNIEPYQSERTLTLANGYPYVNSNTGESLLGYRFYAENPNPLLKPERVISQEYGANISFLNDRIVADITYYYQRNNSVILNVANAWLSGYPSLDNAGAFRNNGLEVDLKLDPLFQFPNGMALTLDGRFAMNDNKVLRLTDIYGGLFPVRDPSGELFYAQEGGHAFSFAYRDWVRDPQGRVIVDKTTGMPQSQAYNDYSLRGRTLPKYSASIGLNFNWKNFSASILFDYLGGYDHKFDTEQSMWSGLHTLTTLNNRERFVFPHSVYDDGNGKYVENTDVVVSNANQELYNQFAMVNLHGLTSAAFWKLREVAFQYTFSLKRGTLKEVVASLYGRDLFSIYPRSNINGDPGLIKGPGQRQFSSVPNNLSGGASDNTVLPGTVLIGFTVGLKF